MMRLRTKPFICLLVAAGLTLGAPAMARASFLDWWLTPDQQGQRLLAQGKPEEAAEVFTTPDRIGAALFQAGEFENAAAVFGRVRGPEGSYNRGNALIMLGQYQAAIDSFDKALEARPDWQEAGENRAIAVARLAALAPPEDDAGGTGGMLGADEIVIDDSGRVEAGGQDITLEAEDVPADESALRAMWLRKVDTRPEDFLAAKFNAQLSQEDSE